jgi:lysophospholipase L1-like esterase
MKLVLAVLMIAFSGQAQTSLRIALAGDSTVCDYPDTTQQRGWGQYIQGYFNEHVKVFNLAKGGRSTKTFLNEGLWAKTLALKPDIILIQFGHNDSHNPKNPEATNAATDYSDYLRRFVDEARAAGAVPILVTPVQRRTEVDTLIPYAEAMRKVAAEKKAALIDLHRSSGELYRELGRAGAAELAANSTDGTHFNEKGARAMAALVMKELPELDPRLKRDLK